MVYIDIILLAFIAIFLILRLRSMLGERNDHERQQADSRSAGTTEHIRNDKVVVLDIKHRKKQTHEENTDENTPDQQDENIESYCLEECYDEAKSFAIRFKTFSFSTFIKGAEQAFDMILSAYAKGNIAALKRLLNKNMLKTFDEGIKNNKKKKLKLEFSLVRVEGKVTSIHVDKNVARLEVLFSSEQVNVIRNPNGDVLDGDPKNVDLCEDTWIFERNMNSQSPAWLLVETK